MVSSQKFLFKVFLFYIFIGFIISKTQAYPTDEESEEVIGSPLSYSSSSSREGSQQSQTISSQSNSQKKRKGKTRILKSGSSESPSKIRKTDTSERLPWTHSPSNGQTIYATREARFECPSKKNPFRSFKIEVPFTDRLYDLNEELNAEQSNSAFPNHLFVTLRVGFKFKGDLHLSWKNFVLAVNDRKNRFRFLNTEEKSPHYSVADFYTQASQKWETEKSRKVDGNKVRYVSFPSNAADERKNKKHSEMGVIRFLEVNKELIFGVLQKLNQGAKLKVVQFGFHSFYDFCEACGKEVAAYQSRLKSDLQSMLEDEAFKNLSMTPDKVRKVVVLITGFNNRPYKDKKYYFFDEEKKAEHALELKGWKFLRDFNPFPGVLLPNNEISSRLVTVLLKPTKSERSHEVGIYDKVAVFPLSFMRSSLSLDGKNLYTDSQEYSTHMTFDLLTIDLTGGRLGIGEEEVSETEHAIFGSNGQEVVACVTAMAQCTRLRNLYLSGNWILNPTRNMAFLGFFSQLQVLTLSNCDLWMSEDIKTLSEPLASLTRLRVLDLSRNRLYSNEFQQGMAQSLMALKYLTHLNLSHNYLSRDRLRGPSFPTLETLVWVCKFLKERLSHRTERSDEDIPLMVDLRENEFSRNDIDARLGIRTSELGCTFTQFIEIFQRVNLGIPGIFYPFFESEASDREREKEKNSSSDEASEDED